MDRVEPSGWKVAKVMIMLGRLSPSMPAGAYCDIEVGVPGENFEGIIRDEVAQFEAAQAADKAARIVLAQRLPTAVLCIRFREEMQRLLRLAIPGARVTKFQTFNLPHETFP